MLLERKNAKTLARRSCGTSIVPLNVFESWHILVFGRVRGYSVFLSMSQIMSQRYCEDKENPAMESLVVGPGFSLR